MWNLRIDAATAEVIGFLRGKGVQSVVLKGPALSDWYPPDSDRTYVDGDIWVAPDCVSAAEGALQELGFVASADELDLPRWWVDHSSGWYRESDRGSIDLHRRLQGTEGDPQAVWDLLWPQTEEFTVGGQTARRLPSSARALYSVLHAAGHGAGDAYSLKHLAAALDYVDDRTWGEAHTLARQVGALDTFAVGLRLLPEGSALAGRINVPLGRSVTTTLLASAPPSVALGIEELLSARGLGRVKVLLRKLVPPPGLIRMWWPRARANRAMLLVGYFYRPLWLAVRAPAGYRAWRAAKREVSKSS